MATSKTIVLITGATSGVGYGLAAQLLKRGSYHVLVGSRSHERATNAVKQLKSEHQSQSDAIEMLQIDVTDDDSIDKAAATVQEKHGKVDIVRALILDLIDDFYDTDDCVDRQQRRHCSNGLTLAASHASSLRSQCCRARGCCQSILASPPEV